MLNTGCDSTQPTNVVYSGYHLWYKLKQDATIVSYLSVRGVSAVADIISIKPALDFKCLHVDDSNSAFADLHIPMLNDCYGIPGRLMRVSTCLGINTLRLPTQAEIDAIPEDDAVALFGNSTVVVQESEAISEGSLVFAVADIEVDYVKIFEDEDTYYQCMIEDLASVGKRRLQMNSLFAYWIVPFTLQVEVNVKISDLDEFQARRAIAEFIHSSQITKFWNDMQNSALNTFPVTEPMNFMQGLKKISDNSYEVQELFIIENTIGATTEEMVKCNILDAELSAWKSSGIIYDYTIEEPELVRGSLNAKNAISAEPQQISI